MNVQSQSSISPSTAPPGYGNDEKSGTFPTSSYANPGTEVECLSILSGIFSRDETKHSETNENVALTTLDQQTTPYDNQTLTTAESTRNGFVDILKTSADTLSDAYDILQNNEQSFSKANDSNSHPPCSVENVTNASSSYPPCIMPPLINYSNVHTNENTPEAQEYIHLQPSPRPTLPEAMLNFESPYRNTTDLFPMLDPYLSHSMRSDALSDPSAFYWQRYYYNYWMNYFAQQYRAMPNYCTPEQLYFAQCRPSTYQPNVGRKPPLEPTALERPVNAPLPMPPKAAKRKHVDFDMAREFVEEQPRAPLLEPGKVGRPPKKRPYECMQVKPKMTDITPGDILEHLANMISKEKNARIQHQDGRSEEEIGNENTSAEVVDDRIPLLSELTQHYYRGFETESKIKEKVKKKRGRKPKERKPLQCAGVTIIETVGQ